MEYRLRDIKEEAVELDESEHENLEAIATRIKSSLDAVKNFEDEQVDIGNTKFLKKVNEANSKNITFVDEN